MRYLMTGIVLLAICFIIPPVALADFTESAQFGRGDTTSLAWGDCDNDGDLDLAVGNALYEQNYLYINNGDGTFTQSAQFGTGKTYSVAWGDCDNDGDLDLAVGNYAQQNYLYVNNGDGTFTSQAQFGMGYTRSVAWGDYDNDGDLDLAVGNVGQSYLYVNNGDGTFTESTQFGTGGTFSVAWGDYDNDGDLDLAVGNYDNQENYLYVNNGDGTFTESKQFGTGKTRSVAWGDYDNDGDIDIVVGNVGQRYLYINNGDGTFTEQAQFGTGNTQSIAWGDYDNDGDIDLAVATASYQQNYLYINLGDAGFASQPQFGTGYSISIAWGDYDNDGDLDLAVGNNGQSYLYINNEDDDDYLSIHLIGHYHDQGFGYSNRDGTGAKVFIYEQGYLGDDDHLLGFREIEANGGYCGQDSIEAEFGLPYDDYVDILVIWPGSDGSHIEEHWDSVAKTQFLTLHEGGGIDVDVCLLSFTATAEGSTIALRWQVQTTPPMAGGEQILGFNLYRRELGGDYGGGGDGVRTDGHPSLREYDVDTWTKVNDHLITGENPYTYTDSDVESGVAYEYKLEAMLDIGAETLGTTQTTAGLPPPSFAILALYPNPASDILTCLLALPSAGAVELTLYDLSGRLVIERLMEVTEPSETEAVLDVSGLASGVYTLRASMGNVEVSPACGGVAVVVR